MDLSNPTHPWRQLPPLPSCFPLPGKPISLTRYSHIEVPLRHCVSGPSTPDFTLLPLDQPREEHSAFSTLPSIHHPFFPHTKIPIPPHPFTVPTDKAFLRDHPPRFHGNKRAHDMAFPVGRPRSESTQKEVYNPRKKPTRLRIDKPVKADVHADIWEEIFRVTDPNTLLGLRSTCKIFHEILSKEALWKQCRGNMFRDSPPPPKGLSEPRYMDLLAGSGCMTCSIKRTKRVQWAFKSRLCDKCFTTRTMKVREIFGACKYNLQFANSLGE